MSPLEGLGRQETPVVYPEIQLEMAAAGGATWDNVNAGVDEELHVRQGARPKRRAEGAVVVRQLGHHLAEDVAVVAVAALRVVHQALCESSQVSGEGAGQGGLEEGQRG